MSEAKMYHRFAEDRALTALRDTSAVLVIGPRRAGKTTLVRGLADSKRLYLTLDDQVALNAAKGDPAGFIRNLDKVTIDEIQRAPELLLAIKKSIDEDTRPGRFLLTGSANVMTLPRVADSLAGRMETIRMLPLAQAEVAGVKPRFLHHLFAGSMRGPKSVIVGDDLTHLVLSGGFPEMNARTTEARRQEWARSYLDSVLTRDLRDIAEIERLTDLPRFVRLLAEYSGQLANFTELGASIGISYKTAQRYIGLLEQVFLVATLRPWHTNAIKRIVKTPKIHFLDSGVLATTRGLSFSGLKKERSAFGPALESFVFSEILKLMTASDDHLTPYHFRDASKHEVDIVLERADGQVAGIEVKASATINGGDFSGLRKLSEAHKRKFSCGVVLYDGKDVVPFGDRLLAIPLSNLWS